MPFFSFSFPDLPRVRVAFSFPGAQGAGDSPMRGNLSYDVADDRASVTKNRLALQAALGFAAWAELRQVHGDVLHLKARPTPLDEPSRIEGDGLATSTPGLALVIKTADCQPVLLAHESGRHVAALHVGWRGNRLHFPASAVARLCQAWSCPPQALFAVRGPSLGPKHAQFLNMEKEWPPAFWRWWRPETRSMDLWAMTRDELVEAGLRPERVFGIDECTLAGAERFFSYRANPRCGRQASLIWIEETA